MKHQQMHTKTPTFCYYFNSNLDCPFEEIGCKFLHEKAGKCKSLQCVRKMCPFEHFSASEEIMKVTNSDVTNEKVDDLNTFKVECMMCGCTFVDGTELEWHLRANHSDSV